MSRALVNLLLDAALLFLVLAVASTAAVLRFVFPPATLAQGWTLWGWGYDRWSDLLFALLALIGIAILVHVMLHWSWVCGIVAKRLIRSSKKGPLSDGSQTLYGVGLLIVILNVLGGLLAAAALSIKSSPGL